MNKQKISIVDLMPPKQDKNQGQSLVYFLPSGTSPSHQLYNNSDDVEKYKGNPHILYCINEAYKLPL